MSAPVKSPPAVTTKPEWTWPAEVLQLAREKQQDQYLDALLEAVRQVFSTANWIKVRVEQDPEDAAWQTVVFHIGVTGLSPRECAEHRSRWSREWARICPYPRYPMFVLDIEPED
jgi:hypothetical protein